MAKRLFWKIWSVVISSLALVGANFCHVGQAAEETNNTSTWRVPVRRSERPDLFLDQAPLQDSSLLLSAHRSHSSHRSHRSHRSHYSGSSRSYRIKASKAETSVSAAQPTKVSSSPGVAASKTAVTLPDSCTKPEIKKIYMTNGAFIGCDCIWQNEGKVFFTKGGKTFSLPLDDVNLSRTMGAKKTKKSGK